MWRTGSLYFDQVLKKMSEEGEKLSVLHNPSNSTETKLVNKNKNSSSSSIKMKSGSVLISTSTKQQLTKPSIESGSTSNVRPSKLHSGDVTHRRYADGSTDHHTKDSTIIPISSPKKTDNHLITTHHRKIPLKSASNNHLDSKNRKQLNDHKQVSLFGVNLSRFPSWIQALLLTAIILFGFIAIGYVEEGFKFEFHDFSFGWFMTAVELIIFSIFAMIERLFKSLGTITSAVYLSSASTLNLNLPSSQQQEQLESEVESLLSPTKETTSPSSSRQSININNNDTSQTQYGVDTNTSKICLLFKTNWFNVIFEKQMPVKYHLMVAAAMMCSRALTNIALLLLNYPTQVIFKSMKLISVMIGSVCCLKKAYHKCEYIAAPLLVASAVLFTLGDSNDLNFNASGIIVVLISLIFDAIHANSQQYILQAKTERDTTMELLVYTNLFAGGMALVVAFITGELTQIWYDYIPNQGEDVVEKLFMWFLIRVACLYIGVSAYVVFTKRFGAVFAGMYISLFVYHGFISFYCIIHVH